MKNFILFLMFFFSIITCSFANNPTETPSRKKVWTEKEKTEFINLIFSGKLSKEELAKIKGKIKVVNNFPDYKVKIVENFADINIEVVSHFPDSEGEWKFVENFPDFTIQFVENFPDFTIKYVKKFPGVQ